MNSVSSPIGVAEQFAIAEAKLRAWSSVDGEDSTDESYDEDFVGGTDSGETTSHPMLVLPTGVKLPDKPWDSELSLWKGRGEVQTLSWQPLTFLVRRTAHARGWATSR